MLSSIELTCLGAGSCVVFIQKTRKRLDISAQTLSVEGIVIDMIYRQKSYRNLMTP